MRQASLRVLKEACPPIRLVAAHGSFVFVMSLVPARNAKSGRSLAGMECLHL